MSGSRQFATEDLRNFYFSKASKFSAFKAAESVTPSNTQTAPLPGTPGQRPAPSKVPAPSHEALADAPAATLALTAPPSASAQSRGKNAAGSAVAAARAAANPTAAATSTALAAPTTAAANHVNPTPTPNGDAVSPAYIAFLRQQQDLIKFHASIDDIFRGYLAVTAQQHAGHTGEVKAARDLLGEAELSTDWHWRSKFNAEALAKDAGLDVPPEVLKNAEDPPVITDLQYQQQQIVKLKQAYIGENKPHTADFKLVLENGIRRMERLVKEYSNSQLDATPVVRLSDNLLVQLDYILAQSPLEVILRDANDTLLVLSKKQKECMAIRDQAHEDGEMNVAERETFRLADICEELNDAQVEKIHILERALQENVVSASVRDQYAKQADDESNALEKETAELKSRCEIDLARIYTLKQNVEEAEELIRTRVQAEREASDERLEKLSVLQEEAWGKIEVLIKQIRQIEVERHTEVKKRVEEKVKDEARRNEFAVFLAVANEKAVDYDRTIKNCDVGIHCSKLMAEFLQSGFYAIQKSLSSRNAAISEALLESQKGHNVVSRSLLFTLGDLVYKKERRVDEVGEQIQAAHIQQEMCNDSLNPNAKKFSDAKKDLLRVRDELELEIQDLRERQKAAIEKYNPSEEALVHAKVEHTHPLDDLEERLLNMRKKMIGYKSMALGLVSSAPLRTELDVLDATLQETRRIVTNVKQSPARQPRLQ